MAVEVVWAERALEKLRQILKRIAGDRPATARRVINRIFERSEQLSEFPELGRPYEAVPGAGLRVLVEGRYRLFYVLDGSPQRVVILAVRHEREPDPEAEDLPDPDELG